MPHFHCKPFSLPITFVFLLSAAPALCPAQQSSAAASKAPAVDKADAYFHYAMGHLYEELAGAYGNRGDYVNKAIDNFRLAMKEDPGASFLVKEIAQLYSAAGMLPEAVKEAETALKANPEDLNAHRVLASVYTRQIGDPQGNRVDEGMAKKAIEQYELVVSKDPKDIESLVTLAKLQKVLGNSLDAEKAFKQVLAIDPTNDDAVIGLSNVYSDRGNPKAAAELLQKLNEKSASPRTLIALASEYEQTHDYAKAAESYRRALEIDSSRSELQGAMAQDLALSGQYDEALKAYQAFSSANPQSVEPYLGMAQVYRQQKKWQEAQASLDKAKAIEPENIEAQYNEALLLQDEGKFAQAISQMKAIIAATSKAGGSAGERSAAVQMLDRLGQLYRLNQQYEDAVATYRQITAVDPELAPKAEAQVIETYRAARNYTKAREVSDAASAKYPTDPALAEAKSEVLGDLGKTEESVAVLRKLMNGANDREIDVLIAQRYLAARRWDEAAKAIDEAEKLSATRDDREAVLFLRGEMYERQKQFELAEKEFRKVLAEDPDNASALNYLGYMLADRGVRLSEAQSFIQRAVHLEPNNYAFLDSLGWVYFRQNKLDEAEQQLRRSVQISSDDPTIHDHLGDVFVKEGKLKEAIEQWQASLKAYNASAPGEVEPDEVSKVQKKLDTARVRLAEMK